MNGCLDNDDLKGTARAFWRSLLKTGRVCRSVVQRGFPVSGVAAATSSGRPAGVAQSVEHVLGKDGVTGSIPVSSFANELRGVKLPIPVSSPVGHAIAIHGRRTTSAPHIARGLMHVIVA